MIESTPIKEVINEHLYGKDEPVITWVYLPIGTWDNVRIYYKGNRDTKDLVFYVLQFGGCISGDYDTDYWTAPSLEVTVLAHGYGYFDGIRHIWMNPEDKGYLYYANTAMLSDVFSGLRGLENMFHLEHDEGY